MDHSPNMGVWVAAAAAVLILNMAIGLPLLHLVEKEHRLAPIVERVHGALLWPLVVALWVFLGAIMLAPGAPAATLPATPATLDAVLKSARGGDVVQLGPGAYARTGLRDRAFSPALTISGTTDAVLTGFGLSGVTGVRLKGGAWRALCGPAPPCYNAAIEVFGSADVTIDGAAVTGPEESRPGYMGFAADGYGIRIRQSRGVVVQASEIAGFKVGVVFDHVADFAALNLRLVRMRSDGIDVAQGWRGRIEGITCDAFRPLGPEHPDCVQLWSRPDAPPTSDIVIRGNLATGQMQGFSGFNHIRAGVDDGGFDRIIIEANYVAVAFPQAVSLMSGRASAVRGNTVRTLPGAPFRASINVGPGVTSCGNTIAPGAGKAGVTEAACAP